MNITKSKSNMYEEFNYTSSTILTKPSEKIRIFFFHFFYSSLTNGLFLSAVNTLQKVIRKYDKNSTKTHTYTWELQLFFSNQFFF